MPLLEGDFLLGFALLVQSLNLFILLQDQLAFQVLHFLLSSLPELLFPLQLLLLSGFSLSVLPLELRLLFQLNADLLGLRPLQRLDPMVNFFLRCFALLSDGLIHFALELGFAFFLFAAELSEHTLLLESELFDCQASRGQQLVDGLLASRRGKQVGDDLVMRVIAFEVVIYVLLLDLAEELLLDVLAQIGVLRVVHDEQHNDQDAGVLCFLSDS